MLDPDRKQSGFYGRANHQLRQIQYNCRQVISMSKYLTTLTTEMASSQINCKKIQIFKTQIKDKLKQFASNIDEIYKILDKKIIIILSEFKKIENKDDKQNICNKCINNGKAKVDNATKLTNSETQRMFSDTLNPRITHLQSKINQYQQNEVKLKNKITQLKNKNQALLDQFNRLSTASNKKINQLTNKISNSFSSDQQVFEHSPKKVSNTPILSFVQPSSIKAKKNTPVYYQSQQFSYQQSNEGSYTSQPLHQEEKKNLLNFGCMPAKVEKVKNPLGISNISQSYEKLDRNDKNRRFDLLLNKLRNSNQESTDQSHSQQIRQVQQQPASVFSHNIVQRYQI